MSSPYFCAIATLLAYLPACIVPITPDEISRSQFAKTFLEYGDFLYKNVVSRIFIWTHVSTGKWMFSLSDNGLLNLFLGNNADPHSAFGIGSLKKYREVFQSHNATYLDAVKCFFFTFQADLPPTS